MATVETASSLAPDPLPDLAAWMPDIDGSALDAVPSNAGQRRNAATALLASPAIGEFAGARRLTGPDGATLVVDPEADAYYFESTRPAALAALLRLPASAWAPAYSKSLAETRASSAAQPLARLRWFAGLLSSPGILAPTLERGARYRLLRWATIEREYPRHFRIAKQFLEHAITIDAAATAAGVPVAEVIDYVNAGAASQRLTVVA